MQRLTHFIQGHQRVILELKQNDLQKSLVQALKELTQKRAAAAAAVGNTTRIHDHRNDVAQGVQRQIHTGWKCHSSGGSRFGEAYEPWSDDMACILQGSCLPGSTRYCRTLSMFTKMDLKDIMQATTVNSFPDGKRHYHTSSAAKLPLWSSSAHSRKAMSPLAMAQYSTESSQDKTEPQPDQGQVSQRQRLKMAVRDYGSTVVVFHVCISLMSLGGFYLAVSSGIDMQSLLSTLGFSADIIQSKVATGTSTFVMAYAVHKVFAPVRIGITLTCTPFIVRYLRGIGLLKRPLPTK
nr:protein FAM210B, mitochondrial-like [Lytechinus pictus]